MTLPADRDPWARLRPFTPARIGLGRAGTAIATTDQLAFQLAHAQARDAVHAPFDAAALVAEVAKRRLGVLHLMSSAPDKSSYLASPDLGRRLNDASRLKLAERAHDLACDLVVVMADGLSALAIHRHALPLLDALARRLNGAFEIGTVAVVERGRVAIGDEIGAGLKAALVAVLIGERPGLSSPDSLGVYLTWAPKVGRRDADRNCISNIRPQGLDYEAAAEKLSYLIGEAQRRQLTGVRLKDETGAALLEST